MSLVSSCCQTAKLYLKEKIENNPKGCNKDNAHSSVCEQIYSEYLHYLGFLESSILSPKASFNLISERKKGSFFSRRP